MDGSGNAAHTCFGYDGQRDESPWKIGSPGGGGWSQDIHYTKKDYGSVADKFYTVRAARLLMKQTERVWDIFVFSVERKAELDNYQIVTIQAFYEDIFRSPVRTGDFVVMTISNTSAFISYIGFLAGPTVGGGIALAVTLGCSVWSSLRYLGIISEPQEK